jgi:hypothetical protein
MGNQLLSPEITNLKTQIENISRMAEPISPEHLAVKVKLEKELSRR